MSDRAVLILDDNDQHRRFVARCLKDQASAIFEAATIEEAEKVIATQSIQSAVVDLNLTTAQELEGLAFMESVGRSHPETRVVVLTGAMRPGLTELCYERGACAVLHKPASVNLIRNLV